MPRVSQLVYPVEIGVFEQNMLVWCDLAFFRPLFELMRSSKIAPLSTPDQPVPRKVPDRAASDVRIWIEVHRTLSEVGHTPV